MVQTTSGWNQIGRPAVKHFRLLLLPLLAVLLSGCNAVVLFPSGDVAIQQRDILLFSTFLMLLIIIPVMVLTVFFAWKYRESNLQANYDPEFDHSAQLELVIWAAPLLIIICIGAVTWASTHLLDPYRPLDRISDNRLVTASDKPLEVDVVAMDWKWLFILPEQGIAVVNELAAPVNRPISFRITASSVMNTFYIPALAGMVYAMPGMQTPLQAVINKSGEYDGFSANYSGSGFWSMNFKFHGMSDADFEKWVADAKAKGTTLDLAAYRQLEKPSESEPVRYYASFEPGLFKRILNLCVDPNKMCLSEMAAIDAKGGLGLEGVSNTLPLEYDKFARRGAVFGTDPSYVVTLCYPRETAESREPRSAAVTIGNPAPLVGEGLTKPPFRLFSPRDPFNS
jgi:cytochrome o ubiquinol oxidase subunit 2